MANGRDPVVLTPAESRATIHMLREKNDFWREKYFDELSRSAIFKRRAMEWKNFSIYWFFMAAMMTCAFWLEVWRHAHVH